LRGRVRQTCADDAALAPVPSAPDYEEAKAAYLIHLEGWAVSRQMKLAMFGKPAALGALLKGNS
jgi:hypothetical protein